MSELIPVKSSNIKAVGYDPTAEALTVQFHGGATHRYAGVAAKDHAALMNAESFGKHFHAHIKNNFKSSKVED